jgi:plasmid stabilization system protein ParE
MVTIWSKTAMSELRKAYHYIQLDSIQNAEIVRDEIIDITIALPRHPEKYPLDKFKKNNDGTWRAFEKYHYRVSCRVTPQAIRIVRLRHTSRSPLTF